MRLLFEFEILEMIPYYSKFEKFEKLVRCSDLEIEFLDIPPVGNWSDLKQGIVDDFLFVAVLLFVL